MGALLRFIIIPAVFILITNCGVSAGWFHQSAPTNSHLYSVNSHHGNENIAWACGENGVMLHTTNGGLNWVLQNTGTSNNLYAVVFIEVTGGPVMAVGENGTILRTTNNGSNWVIIPSPTSKTLYDISDFNSIIVGDSGIILRSTDIGLTWSEISSPTTKALYTVCSGFGYYAGGEDGTIIRGFNSGINWTLLQSGVNNNLKGTPLFGSVDIISGDNGMILKSTNSGINWSAQNTMTIKNLNSLEYSVNNTSRIYCVGDIGTILKTTNSGLNWGFQQSGTSENLNSVFFYLNDNTGYAAGNNGTILKTTDGGGSITLTDPHVNTTVPNNILLYQNYPNPFNPATSIKFKVRSSASISLKVYDTSGREISELVNEMLSAGEYSYNFDGSNLSSGIYLYRLFAAGKAGEFSETKKMILIK